MIVSFKVDLKPIASESETTLAPKFGLKSQIVLALVKNDILRSNYEG